MATTRVVGFNKDGYQMTLAILDEKQTRMTVTGINKDTLDILNAQRSGTEYSGIAFDPDKFPEVVRQVIIHEK